jgi:cysteine sulfinate desulfinase/cysteine desulfurase-like protein
VRRGAPIEALIVGGSQEAERRAGTENVPGIVGLGAAAELAERWLQADRPGAARGPARPARARTCCEAHPARCASAARGSRALRAPAT